MFPIEDSLSFFFEVLLVFRMHGQLGLDWGGVTDLFTVTKCECIYSFMGWDILTHLHYWKVISFHRHSTSLLNLEVGSLDAHWILR